MKHIVIIRKNEKSFYEIDKLPTNEKYTFIMASRGYGKSFFYNQLVKRELYKELVTILQRYLDKRTL